MDDIAIAYICDKKQCEYCSADAGFCYHTTDIRHAVNVKELEPGKFMEENSEYKYCKELSEKLKQKLDETEELLAKAYAVIGQLIEQQNPFE